MFKDKFSNCREYSTEKFYFKEKKKKLSTQMHCFALLELDRQLCAGRFENWQQVHAQSLLNLWEFKTCHLSQSAQIAAAMRIFCLCFSSSSIELELKETLFQNMKLKKMDMIFRWHKICTIEV